MTKTSTERAPYAMSDIQPATTPDAIGLRIVQELTAIRKLLEKSANENELRGL